MIGRSASAGEIGSAPPLIHRPLAVPVTYFFCRGLSVFPTRSQHPFQEQRRRVCSSSLPRQQKKIPTLLFEKKKYFARSRDTPGASQSTFFFQFLSLFFIFVCLRAVRPFKRGREIHRNKFRLINDWTDEDHLKPTTDSIILSRKSIFQNLFPSNPIMIDDIHSFFFQIHQESIQSTKNLQCAVKKTIVILMQHKSVNKSVNNPNIFC